MSILIVSRLILEVKGEKGDTGAATVILGSYDTFDELIAAHPTANEGDAFLVDGELFVWHRD